MEKYKVYSDGYINQDGSIIDPCPKGEYDTYGDAQLRLHGIENKGIGGYIVKLIPDPIHEWVEDEDWGEKRVDEIPGLPESYMRCWYWKNTAYSIQKREMELFYCRVDEKYTNQYGNYAKCQLFRGDTFDPNKKGNIVKDICEADLVPFHNA